jgi:hypothetical protein
MTLPIEILLLTFHPKEHCMMRWLLWLIYGTDIIDGYGSYPHHFMSTPVFCGLGEVAFKYYMLFQHQSVVDEGQADEPSWLLGAAPGPYINELSRSVFMFLGKHVAFLGIDARTERMVSLDSISCREIY